MISGSLLYAKSTIILAACYKPNSWSKADLDRVHFLVNLFLEGDWWNWLFPVGKRMQSPLLGMGEVSKVVPYGQRCHLLATAGWANSLQAEGIINKLDFLPLAGITSKSSLWKVLKKLIIMWLHLLSKWTIPSIWSINPFMRPSVIIWEAIFSAWSNKERCQKLCSQRS